MGRVSREAHGNTLHSVYILMIVTLMGILYLSPEMIKQNGKIMKFKYNPKTVFGLVGITAERLTDFYALIYMARLPFAHMGCTSPSRAIQKVLGKVCYRSRAGEYRLIEKI